MTGRDLIGEVFVWSGGYDQTRIYFYEVIAGTPKTVTVQRIGEVRDPDDLTLTPDRSVRGEVVKHRRLRWDEERGRVSILVNKGFPYGAANMWDGTPQRDTATDSGSVHGAAWR